MDQPIRILFNGQARRQDFSLEVDQAPGLLEAALGAIPGEFSVIDEDGVAVVANEPARRFMLERHGLYWGPGVRLLDIVHHALNPQLADEVMSSLPLVRSGDMPSFVGTYEIGVGEDAQVKQIRMVRFSYLRTSMVVLIQRDVTDLSAAHREVEALNHRLLATQEDERRRIARELHDSTGQHLVAASLALAWLPAAQQVADGTPLTAPAVMALKDATASLREAQKEIRLLSYLLHPPNLEEDGLTLSLSQFVVGFARRSGLKCQVRIKGEFGGLDFELQRSFLRVVQEALINVHRHADASTAEVKLSRSRGMLSVEVRDNGHGMGRSCDGSAEGLGVGIPGMRARLLQLGGVLEIHDSPQGVTVCARAPIKRLVREPPDSCGRRSARGPPSSKRRASASPQPGASPPS